MSDELDILLSSPLAPVADEGFSTQVMKRVRAEQFQRMALTIAVIALCSLPIFLLIPVPRLGAELGSLVPEIAGSLAVNFAAAALILTYLFDRQFSRL